MLTLETARGLFGRIRDLPAASRVGLLVMVTAGVVDVLVHVASGDHAGHSGIADAAQLIGVVGMVLVLGGVVIDGARRQLRRAAAKPGGLDPNAHR
jgi:hypothetical protein